MSEQPDEPEIVPDPDLERAASMLLRDVVRYIVESGDEPDTTPERLEAATGVTFGAEIAGGYVHTDERDERYRCILDFTPPPSQVVGVVLTLRVNDLSRREWRPLVLDPDVTSVATTLENAGFRGYETRGQHGSLGSMRFRRDALEVELRWRWRAVLVDTRRCVTGVVTHWIPND